MVIGIEAQRIFRKKKHGMDMVALEMIRHLQLIDTVNQYVIFVKPDEDSSVLQETANFRIVALNGGAYPLWEQVALPRAARKYGCHLLHCTGNTAPLFGNIPLVLTLHDIIYMEHSISEIIGGEGSNYQKFGNVYRRLVVPRLVKKSNRIITVSDYEKKRIAEFFSLKDDGRLTTGYNGVGENFKPVTDAQQLKAIKEKYKLPDQFFFFLGNTHPKKNTPGTLIAFAEYLKETGGEEQLVMIDYDRAELEKLLSEIGAPELINKIVLTGYISNQDLPAIYSQCQLFLYPSLRESFGIPIIEAMACGAPVITSHTSSMPEVAGEAALLIDPTATATIAKAMEYIQTNQTLKKELIAEGLMQARKFSWRTLAQQVLTIYHETINEQQLKTACI